METCLAAKHRTPVLCQYRYWHGHVLRDSIQKETLLIIFPALTGVLYFVDLYFVLVRSEKPSQAGLQLIYYMPGAGG